MEYNRVQFRLNPKVKRHQLVIEKLMTTEKSPKEFIIDAILAYGERDTLFGEETLRKILREELKILAVSEEGEREPIRASEQRNEVKNERDGEVKIASRDVEESVAEKDKLGEKAMGLLAAFDSME